MPTAHITKLTAMPSRYWRKPAKLSLRVTRKKTLSDSNELYESHLIDGEQEELEAEYELLSHAEEIKSALFEAESLLADDGGAVERIKRASQSVAQLLDVYPALEELSSRLESSFIEIKDISEEISQRVEDVEYDPARMETVNNRLDQIYHLEQKYHVQTVGELIAIKEELGTKLGRIDNSEENIATT
mgnify:CR=1 FL=1